MPFKELDSALWRKRVSRVLLIGGPNTLKTSAIVRTFPRPLHLMSYPGEKGTGVIPTDDATLKGYVWEEDPSKSSIFDTIKEIEQTTWDILVGNKGEIKTFGGDGLHKLASLYWNREYLKLQSVYEQALDQGKIALNDLQLKAYGNENFGACREIINYVSKVCQSNVDTVVFTCWEGREIDNPEASGKKTSHIFADLPGKLAQRVVGEFGVVAYSEVSLPDPKGKITGAWQIRKSGSVWGVGVKVPYDIAVKLPDKVPQDWQKLYPMLLGEVEPPKSASIPVPQPSK